MVQQNRSSLLRPDIAHIEVSGNFVIKFNEISIRLPVSHVQHLLDIRIYSFFSSQRRFIYILILYGRGDQVCRAQCKGLQAHISLSMKPPKWRRHTVLQRGKWDALLKAMDPPVIEQKAGFIKRPAASICRLARLTAELHVS